MRRLNASGYLSSVQASIDPDPTRPDDATIHVAVLEAPTRSFEGGFGYSTDVLFRANATYRDVNFNGRGLQFLEKREIRMIDEALGKLGEFGEVRLVVEKGRLRYVVTQRSYDALKWSPGQMA
jgi:outer membrane translocation and assembly module TamA